MKTSSQNYFACTKLGINSFETEAVSKYVARSSLAMSRYAGFLRKYFP